jgi:hypothetical protein
MQLKLTLLLGGGGGGTLFRCGNSGRRVGTVLSGGDGGGRSGALGGDLLLLRSGALAVDTLALSLLGASLGGGDLLSRRLALTVELRLLLGALALDQLGPFTLGGSLLTRQIALALRLGGVCDALALGLLGALALERRQLLAALALGQCTLLSKARRVGGGNALLLSGARSLGRLLGALLLELGLLLRGDAARLGRLLAHSIDGALRRIGGGLRGTVGALALRQRQLLGLEARLGSRLGRRLSGGTALGLGLGSEFGLAHRLCGALGVGGACRLEQAALVLHALALRLELALGDDARRLGLLTRHLGALDRHGALALGLGRLGGALALALRLGEIACARIGLGAHGSLERLEIGATLGLALLGGTLAIRLDLATLELGGLERRLTLLLVVAQLDDLRLQLAAALGLAVLQLRELRARRLERRLLLGAQAHLCRCSLCSVDTRRLTLTRTLSLNAIALCTKRLLRLCNACLGISGDSGRGRSRLVALTLTLALPQLQRTVERSGSLDATTLILSGACTCLLLTLETLGVGASLRVCSALEQLGQLRTRRFTTRRMRCSVVTERSGGL